MQVKYVIIAVLLVALAVLFVPAAAQTPAATGFPVNITDDKGVVTTVDKAPERIISLSPANTEILFDLGVGGRIVGVDDYSNYPAAARNITRVSGFQTVNYEKIAAANPDLIFVEDIIGEEAVTRLRGMGYKVIELKNNNLTMVRHDIELMGRATGTSANATALVSRIDANVSDIRAKAAKLSESQKPRVLMVISIWEDTIYPFGNNTYGDELIALAGGKNVAKNISEFSVMSHEAIIKEDPDLIIVPVDDLSRVYYEQFANGTMAWATGLTAYKNHRVYELDADVVNRPPRLADTGEMISDIIQQYVANVTATATPGASPSATPAPGFGALIALAGLLGVACLISKKR